MPQGCSTKLSVLINILVSQRNEEIDFIMAPENLQKLYFTKGFCFSGQTVAECMKNVLYVSIMPCFHITYEDQVQNTEHEVNSEYKYELKLCNQFKKNQNNAQGQSFKMPFMSLTFQGSNTNAYTYISPPKTTL